MSGQDGPCAVECTRGCACISASMQLGCRVLHGFRQSTMREPISPTTTGNLWQAPVPL